MKENIVCKFEKAIDLQNSGVPSHVSTHPCNPKLELMDRVPQSSLYLRVCCGPER